MSDSAEIVLLVIGTAVAFVIVIAADFAKQPLIDDSIAHWHVTVPGLKVKPERFFESVSLAVRRHDVPNISYARVELYESHIASHTRPYLRISLKRLSFYVFAAPLGESLFISSWFIFKRSLLARVLLATPLIGPLFGRFIQLSEVRTFYSYDSILHFIEIVHGSVLGVVDKLTTADNLPRLEDTARKPIMRELYPQPTAPRMVF